MAKARMINTAVTSSPAPTVLEPNGATTKVREDVSYSTPIKAVGICSTCRHRSRCLFFRAARQPIHNCEEFDSGTAAGDEMSVATSARSGRGRGENPDQGKSTGLCANCETRLTCMHRQPGVEVVQCEDYS